MGFFDFFTKQKKETLDNGLAKTKEGVLGKIARAIAGKSKVDDEVLDDLEEVLITSDVGVDTTLEIIKRIEERVARDKYVNTSELNSILREEIAALLTSNNSSDTEGFQIPNTGRPYVILVVGVNGVGKTTTIGKLAYQFKSAGYKVCLGAADTFRAAAVDQLCIWGERIGVPVDQIVFVDDNENAVKTAKLAGMRSYGIYDASSEAFIEEMKRTSDKYITSFDELIEE